MSGGALRRAFVVLGKDYTNGGRASTAIKDVLKQLGVPPEVVRRVAIASYEAEMNVVMYARRGVMTLVVTPQEVTVTSDDEGPGIADIALAMQEGWSTATPEMREMGFGAGMGLPNMQRNSDELIVTSEVGRGTRVSIRVGLNGQT